MNNKMFIEFESINKRFGGVKALQDVSFSIAENEIHGLVGENGAGKSTLIKIVGGVYKKDFGLIRVQGKQVEINSPTESEELGIAIVHQEIPLCDNLTVAQNVFMHNPILSKYGVPKWKVMEEKTRELFRRIGQDVNPRRHVRGLSIAMRQLTAIAQALNKDSKFIILDEPTAALTPGEVENLLDVLRQLKGNGTTIMMVSHILSEIMSVTDTISVLRNGKHVGVRKTAETDKEEIVKLMVGDVLLEQTARKQSNSQTAKVLEVTDLSQRQLRLKNISFSLHKQEVLGLAGIQGAGRTELAQCLFGVKPHTGKVKVNGKLLDYNNPASAISHGIGYLTEDRRGLGVFWEMNVWQNMLAATIDRFRGTGQALKKKEISQAVEGYKNSMRIKTSSIEQRIRHLSGGNQQKVLLARWLLSEPEILILDEPTRGVDVGAKAEIRGVIQDLVDNGLSIIVISSDLEELFAISDRVLVMANGSIQGEFAADNVSHEKVMALATQK